MTESKVAACRDKCPALSWLSSCYNLMLHVLCYETVYDSACDLSQPTEGSLRLAASRSLNNRNSLLSCSCSPAEESEE